MKSAGVSKKPLKKNESLRERVEQDLAARSKTCIFVAAKVTRLYFARVIADIRASLPRLLLI
jgi:hypothetical protein